MNFIILKQSLPNLVAALRNPNAETQTADYFILVSGGHAHFCLHIPTECSLSSFVMVLRA